VAEAMNELDAHEAVVVGHSTGFDVAVSLAEQSSALADRLVDIGEAPDNSLLSVPFLAGLTHVPVLGEAAWLLAPDAAIKDGYQEPVAPGFDLESGFRDPDQVLHDFRAMTYTSFDATDATQDDFVEAQPLDERSRSTGIPLLVIFGEEDQTWEDPVSAAERYAGVPGALIVALPSVGHSPNVEAPRETARLIERFIDSTR
jgi:pimeloyl-ACP methyl ester carboxylesterase